MSSIWQKISGIFTGGDMVKQIVDGVDRFVTTKEEKAQLENIALQIAHEHELALQSEAFKVEMEFNQRIKDLEGTAKDLVQAGWMGRVVLFLRGAQRPIWGWGTIIIDVLYFLKRLDLTPTGEDMLYTINMIVLAFLFGERTIQNVAPHFKELIRARKQPVTE
ncbi:hypothetical protein [Croceimicrobium hydrocarbonivorans]|uniref:Holin of 3TMs, for gene-transfer release n=1 Tax=Croceimicrobium hydrocarbonivorans TaxID=2761580 RepID=A0A7H0VBB8_9FLAO|nr:hypothetical protein [Croceimicrobium hydrocarbonivorans]QNR22971.1 hypothetical protein H4K34_11335 [Croceimicrobium hydrocarbonivorans]QNR23016.1 hypothetical protein H4K34_11560 [Croceimicrobium hydrocarbonivorans]